MDISMEQQELLSKYLALVIEENKQINLTRIDSCDEGMVLHVEDSLAGVPEVEASLEGPLVDLGSGAGFPGIPLAVATNRSVLLVESVGKKAAALSRMVSKLGLSSVSIYDGRAENLALTQAESFSVVTARALSSLPSLLELASPLLRYGGRLVAYKSQDVDKELEDSLPLEEKLGMRFVVCRELLLSDGTPRTIVVFEKNASPQVSLPRRPGMAQKRPYKV